MSASRRSPQTSITAEKGKDADAVMRTGSGVASLDPIIAFLPSLALYIAERS
jgi:hypothetical protein